MIGKTLAHYEITGLLGRGGMGEVYRAHDTKLQREVALKILPAKLAADPLRIERFEREARTVAGLNHPNIVHIYSVEEDAGVRFLTMELVDGQELAGLLTGEPLPLGQVLEIGTAVADALADAHDKGVVHRDLKPANVMLTESGHVKVLDFGLAKLAHEEPEVLDDATRVDDLTQHGTILGTVPYMSPEQVRGMEIDHRSDIFSVGVLLHELSTGRRPFEGSTAADVISSILKDAPSDISQLRSGLPPELARIVRCCLEKDRDDRYASAGDLAEDLRQLRRQMESGSLHVGSPAPEGTTRARLRRRVRFAVPVALAVLVVAAGMWWSSRDRPSGEESGQRPVVAVLPFENLGGSQEEYFAAGITDEITSRLALIGGLGVVSRTSTRSYAATDKSIRQVGQELGASYVLEGAIRWDKSQQPQKVRISSRLIRVADDTNLWSDNFDQELTEIFSLQATIASRIAEALDVQLVAPERAALTRQSTDDIGAYQAYLQGIKQLYAPGFGQESFELGIQMFSRAVELDPNFAIAYARLSSMHSRLYHYGYDRTEPRLVAARNAVDRALGLDPDLAEAHLAMGHYQYWGSRDYARALAALERAHDLAPGNGEIWLAMAYVKRRQGEFESAVGFFERERELSPLDPNTSVGLGETYGVLRRYEEADRAFRRSIELAPEDPYPYTELALLQLRWRGDTQAARDVLTRMPVVESSEASRIRYLIELLDRRFEAALGVLDAYPGEAFEADAFFLPVDLKRGIVRRLQDEPSLARPAFESARRVLEERLSENDDDPRVHSALGLCHAGLGNEEEAVLHARRAVELYPLGRDALAAPVQLVHLALTYTMVGEREEALSRLEELLSIPSSVTTAWLEADPRWDPLRDHPGYASLLDRFPR